MTVTARTIWQVGTTVASRGATTAIAMEAGDLVKTRDCIVTSTEKPGMRKFSGETYRLQVFDELSCDSMPASAGVPGTSAASPVGRVAKKLETHVAEVRHRRVETCADRTRAPTASGAVCDKIKMRGAS